LHRVATFHDDAAHCLRDFHDLEDAETTFISIIALFAALLLGAEYRDAFVEFLCREAFFFEGFAGNIPDLFAVAAQASCEALGNNQAHRGRDGVRHYAHVDHTRQSLWCVVRMQRRQNQVTGLRGLDGDFRRLEVTNLTDHNHVRILSQECLECRGERQANLGVNVDLVDAWQVDFRRILGCRDVAILGIQNIEAGIQRHRLTGTRRAGDQDHAVWLGEVLLVERTLVVLVPQHLDAQLGARWVQDTQYDLLTEQRWAGVHTKIDRAVFAQAHLDAAVLWYTTFGDVHA